MNDDADSGASNQDKNEGDGPNDDGSAEAQPRGFWNTAKRVAKGFFVDGAGGLVMGLLETAKAQLDRAADAVAYVATRAVMPSLLKQDLKDATAAVNNVVNAVKDVVNDPRAALEKLKDGVATTARSLWEYAKTPEGWGRIGFEVILTIVTSGRLGLATKLTQVGRWVARVKLPKLGQFVDDVVRAVRCTAKSVVHGGDWCFIEGTQVVMDESSESNVSGMPGAPVQAGVATAPLAPSAPPEPPPDHANANGRLAAGMLVLAVGAGASAYAYRERRRQRGAVHDYEGGFDALSEEELLSATRPNFEPDDYATAIAAQTRVRRNAALDAHDPMLLWDGEPLASRTAYRARCRRDQGSAAVLDRQHEPNENQTRSQTSMVQDSKQLRQVSPGKWRSRIAALGAVVCLLCAGPLLWSGLKASQPASAVLVAQRTPLFAAATPAPGPLSAQSPTQSPPTNVARGAPTKPIEQVGIFNRLGGRNPLLSDGERAGIPEPDPATWKQVHLHMLKASGNRLEARLALSSDEIAALAPEVGKTVFLDMPEMGAVGDAEVLSIGPTPPLPPGHGAIVTGIFVHEADENAQILRIEFTDGSVIHGVTDNHPFWSEDRQDFIPAGELRPDERVRTRNGTTQVASVTGRTAQLGEMLYNLQVHGEHVYQVTTGGVLVHNTYARRLRESMRAAGRHLDDGSVPHHIVPRGSYGGNPDVVRAQRVLSRNGIDLDSHWNGTGLPSSRLGGTGRGAIHERVHTQNPQGGRPSYFGELARRLEAAENRGGRSEVLRELRGIAGQLQDGTFPSLHPGNVR